jgi:hypothetical protein
VKPAGLPFSRICRHGFGVRTGLVHVPGRTSSTTGFANPALEWSSPPPPLVRCQGRAASPTSPALLPSLQIHPSPISPSRRPPPPPPPGRRRSRARPLLTPPLAPNLVVRSSGGARCSGGRSGPHAPRRPAGAPRQLRRCGIDDPAAQL